MAQEADDEFSRLWQRHLTMLRDDFSATSVQALPSLPSGPQSFDGEVALGNGPWDDKVDSVVDTLDELALQSPHTAETHSPDTPWFPDREAYTETALSSPLNSSWPRTIGSSKNLGLPHLLIEDYSSVSDLKGKGSSPPTAEASDHQNLGTTTQQYHFFSRNSSKRDDYHHLLDPSGTATTVIPTPTTPNQTRPPAQVHVLILTWENDTNADTETLRATLKRRGYRVQCRVIPHDYPTAAVETILDRFLERSAVAAVDGDSLLLVYYRGWGCLDREGRMAFYSGPGHVASRFFWDDVRDPVMQVPRDVLLVFDCTALPGVWDEQCEMRVEAGMVASSVSTKQLLGVCTPAWYYDDGAGTALLPRDDMTQSLCRTLDGVGDGPVLSVQEGLFARERGSAWHRARVEGVC